MTVHTSPTRQQGWSHPWLARRAGVVPVNPSPLSLATPPTSGRRGAWAPLRGLLQLLRGFAAQHFLLVFGRRPVCLAPQRLSQGAAYPRFSRPCSVSPTTSAHWTRQRARRRASRVRGPPSRLAAEKVAAAVSKPFASF